MCVVALTCLRKKTKKSDMWCLDLVNELTDGAAVSMIQEIFSKKVCDTDSSQKQM